MNYEITKGMRIIGAKCLDRKEERATQTMEATINMIHKKISNIKCKFWSYWCEVSRKRRRPPKPRMEAQWPHPPPTLWAAVFVSVEKTFEVENICVSESKSPKKFVKSSSKASTLQPPTLWDWTNVGIRECRQVGKFRNFQFSQWKYFPFIGENRTKQ